MIAVLVLISSVIIIVITLLITLSYFEKQTLNNALYNPNVVSEIKVDIKEKVVFKRNIDSNSKDESAIYPLEDFIYMISLNPDSKNFRELLKLVNNGAKKELIIKKKKTIQKMTPFFITYSPKSKAMVYAQIDNDPEQDDNFIQIQLSESNIAVKNQDVNFLEDKIEIYNDSQMFDILQKEVKQTKTKGWTLIKVYQNKATLTTTKDYLLNNVQLLKLRTLLMKEGYRPYISSKGFIYMVVSSGRISNHFSIQKQLSNNIYALFSSKRRKDYLDILKSNISIRTANELSKEADLINNALVKVELLSEIEKDKINDRKVVQKIFDRADNIINQSNSLIYLLKDAKPPIRTTEHNVVERSVKPVIEYYVDSGGINVDDVLKYSIRHKRKIIEAIFIHANKEALKYKGQIVTAELKMSNIEEVTNLIEKIKPRTNFYIALSEDTNPLNKPLWNDILDQLNNSKFNTIVVIGKQNNHSLSIIRMAKPKIIILSSDFKNDKETKKLKLTVSSKIEITKDKTTKIYTLK